jgi:hypothetical protein
MRSRRTLWVLLSAALVFFGSLEFHPAGEAHDLSVPAARSYYPLTREAPGKPIHFEAARAEARRPVCPFCLHQLQRSGAHLRARAAVAAPTPPVARTLALALQPASGSRCANSARGPPSVS